MTQMKGGRVTYKTVGILFEWAELLIVQRRLVG